MSLKKVCQKINIFAECKKYHLSIWQCPSFLFCVIGLINIITIISAYVIGNRYAEPEMIALISIVVTTILIIIGYLVIHAFEKLALANHLKTEFVSIASHQLRTPLSGIKWTINLLESELFDNLTAEQIERITDIKESNQRMINLVNDLLNVSRIEQKQINLKPEPISLERLLKELIKEYGSLAKASNVEIDFNYEQNTPSILIDKQGIELILRNLIDNAIRYTVGPGKVYINLTKKNGMVRCEVKDTGVGIPKEDQDKIFQKFFRSRNALRHQTEGTGLGLFIAQEIIKESKGQIGFKSEENKGSTFWFKLPIKS